MSGLGNEYNELLNQMGNGQTFPGTEKGVKLDEGKNKLGLVFQGFAAALWEVGRVGTFGANKYTQNGWQSVKNGQNRYFDALFRHVFKFFEGEQIDSESGIHHLAHAAWNALAILSFELWKNKTKKCVANDKVVDSITVPTKHI